MRASRIRHNHINDRQTQEAAISNELREIYEKAGLIHRFFETKTPLDLYRAQSFKDEEAGRDLIYPHPGYKPKNGPPRLPDVEEFKQGNETFVRGCRTIKGDYRGVSMFDRVNPRFKGGKWYRLPKDTEIPPALAVLQDGELDPNRETHFTIAPKDNMPKALFQVWLNALGAKLVKND